MLGAVFFGGLWWTVRRGVLIEHPASWFLGSLVLRMSIAMAGFYVVSGGHWERLLVSLVGFIIARLVIIWMSRPSGASEALAVQEAGHAAQP